MDKIIIFLKGLAMGAADVVPGVSGGTIAFISGIYERLIKAISSFDKEFIGLLFRFQIGKLWKHIDGTFLILISLGILTSILTLSKLVIFLLETYPVYIRSFFFGLILASVLIVRRKIKEWKHILRFFLIFGIVIAYIITKSNVLETPDNFFTLFVSGFVAIIAMILPGISGSYILLILGKYQYIIGIVANLADKLKELVKALLAMDLSQIPVIFSQMQLFSLFVFFIGALLGLLFFSKMLNRLLSKYHDQMIVVLIGFMIGSLNKVWPWKQTISTYIDRHGVTKPYQQVNILPSTIGDMFSALAFLLLGLIIIILIEKIGNKILSEK